MGTADIQKLVAAKYGVRLEELLGRSRPEPLATYRALAVYLCIKCTDATFAVVAVAFRRSEATVCWNICKVEDRMAVCPEFAQEVRKLMEQLF